MLLNAGKESAKGRSFMVQLLGVPVLIALLGLLAFLCAPHVPVGCDGAFGVLSTGGYGVATTVGHALFTTYLLPFEVTSILILIAIIGAVVLARKEMD